MGVAAAGIGGIDARAEQHASGDVSCGPTCDEDELAVVCGQNISCDTTCEFVTGNDCFQLCCDESCGLADCDSYDCYEWRCVAPCLGDAWYAGTDPCSCSQGVLFCDRHQTPLYTADKDQCLDALCEADVLHGEVCGP